VETKDVLLLLASVDLGVLAAVLTLLAIYPAIGALLKAALGQSHASTLVENNRLRARALSGLKWSIISSWSALTVILLQVLGGFSWRLLHPSATGVGVHEGAPPGCWDLVNVVTSGLLTVASLLLLAFAAQQIFKASVKTG
jgi:hypothetical protein